MQNKILSLTALITASVAFVFPLQPQTQAQEYPGCYVVRPNGRFVDLDPLCVEEEPTKQEQSAISAANSAECQALLVVVTENLQPNTETVIASTNNSTTVQFQADIDNTRTGLREFNQDLENLNLEDTELIQYRSILVANNDNISVVLSDFAEDAIAQNEPERLPTAAVLQTEINTASEDIVEDIEDYCLGSNNASETIENEVQGIETTTTPMNASETAELDTEETEIEPTAPGMGEMPSLESTP
ncbi:MAG: hypothetical protein SAJ12_12840 [Jaaginema sp. PMC 1079.18]|nr:hypothetical protein [Jaaginema sp. PMC 1080.18]MEC4851892.1 hypothetical protein [Jaaginema sp. PMC 1079.18]MEC4866476.1 hypothetical protein [Jaaginema sp. PMC 1078.18]